jgi:hypothetical protein
VLTTDAGVGVQFLFQGSAIIIGVGIYSIQWKNLVGLFARFGGDLTPQAAGGSHS